jgi:hypothetical protein
MYTYGFLGKRTYRLLKVFQRFGKYCIAIFRVNVASTLLLFLPNHISQIPLEIFMKSSQILPSQKFTLKMTNLVFAETSEE